MTDTKHPGNNAKAGATNPGTGPKAGRREWLALGILILPTLIVSMDMTVTYLALPVLSAALKPTSTELLWITDIFGFLEAGLLIVMGSLGDRIGLRKLLLSGASAFTAASILAAFSPSAFWLIVARGGMGIAGASLLPTVLSLIRQLFHDDRQRTFAMGLYTTCFSAGTMLGPVVGGFLLDHFWWGSVFLIPVPLILLLLVAAPFLLPEFKHPSVKGIDPGSAALLITAILPVVYGLKQVAQNGLAVLPVLLMIGGAALAIAFVVRQRRIDNPLIDLRLFQSARFNAAITALFIVLFSWSGIFLFIGQYFQSVVGLNSFSAGLWMLPAATGSILLCMLAPLGLKVFSRGTLMAAGLCTLAVGIAALCFLGTSSLYLAAAAGILLSGGCGLVVTLGIDLVVAAAPPEKAGAAAGLSETSTGFGGSFGIAILGSIWIASYRHSMRTGIGGKLSGLNGNLSGAAAEEARNTIGGAIKQATVLHDHRLALFAKEAFIRGLHLTAAVCAVLVLATALLVAMQFRQSPSSGSRT